MTDLRASAELSTGEILDDRYVLHERIGEGGMARVYRAEDTHLQRSVAVKVFREPTDGIDSVERALSETTLLASLSHHSLVTVFDARVGTGETSYLVMEHVDGITLRDLIARGPVDPKIVASIAIDIAEGLHVAHEHGVVHRDIKPSNVLLWSSPRPGWEWRAKLGDFGIAYLMDSARVTTPGVIVGTMAYVAPEQARGVPPAPAADIYAFGLLLIEALTGERPFGDAEGIGTVVARLSSAPEIPESLHPSWQGLLRGMTAIRPDDRPAALDVVTAASRLAAMENTIARQAADPSTAPVAISVADPTQVFPQPALAAGSAGTLERGALRRDARVAARASGASAGTDEAAAVAPAVPDERGRASRRALMIGVVVAALLALALALGSVLVANSWSADADPASTPPAEEQAPPVPTEEAPPAPTEEAPVEEVPASVPAEQAPAGDPPPADTGGGGDVNDNSGPGNNNGGGGGSGGRGNGNGNGGGNGGGNG
ncbi:serine/threonine-protein kinase [Microbacterium sp. B35-04]|uniref:serine/threonine-protein kinase n=1 Tax=Microbacterium sp. B35-04 TaxID=1961716 RepID=UPI0013D1FA10|nr:serine/threonine-protein kinase [Microbacterium sp. B35-04]